jgi:arginase
MSSIAGAALMALTHERAMGASERRQIALIKAPSNLGLMPQPGEAEPGARKAPEVLMSLGLGERIPFASQQTVDAPAYSPAVDSQTGVRNAGALRSYAEALSEAVQAALERAQFPLILGGDCSILMGSALALRRRGRYGLLYLDAHTDFKLPETSPSKGAAGMDLAFATGHGPESLTRLGGYARLLEEEDVVAFGYHDLKDPGSYTSKAIFETAIHRIDLGEARRQGLEHSARTALRLAANERTHGAFVHLDVDVIDKGVFPAVDTPEEGA